jgi:hypothetical protein
MNFKEMLDLVNCQLRTARTRRGYSVVSVETAGITHTYANPTIDFLKAQSGKSMPDYVRMYSLYVENQLPQRISLVAKRDGEMSSGKKKKRTMYRCELKKEI